MNTIRTELEKLENLFDKLNNHYYKGSLPRPVIQYVSDFKKARYGSLTCDKVWNNEDKTESNYELVIYADWKREKANVVATLLHEMAHLYANINKIQDVSNNGFYHNNKFKEIAEGHGIHVAKYKYHGWTKTTPSAETIELCKTLGDIPNIWYKPTTLSKTETEEELEQPKEPKEKWYKFTCPLCGEVIKCKNENLNLDCTCGGHFEMK